MKRFIAVLVILTASASSAPAMTYYVCTKGNDSNPGTKEKPFETIQKAADIVQPGDICIIRGGTYHQTVKLTQSGKPDKPICFTAEKGATVIVDGTAPVEGKWTKHKGNIYKIGIDADIEQLFAGGKMMVEARWPNMRFDEQLYDRKSWATTVEGSRYGVLKDPRLAETGIDWTGAHITLNVAHQFFTWTRTVTGHGKGGDTLTYPKNLKGITHYAGHAKGWEDDYYFLSGKLEALDAETEWFYDRQKKVLYFHPPGGKDPSALDVKYRRRQYAITGERLKYVKLVGLNFFCCTFNFTKCSHMLVNRCNVRFPTYSRHVRSSSYRRYSTSVYGNHNVIRKCVISYASHSGLRVSGEANIIENCLIHDVCWHGSLDYAGLNVRGEANVSRRNTIYNGGNVLLKCPGPNQRVEYNHVYNGGLLCRDISLIYTQLPRCRGTVIRYNWVHGCMTEGFRGHDGIGGMGIRGDDQTRGLTVHHNVVWDCGIHGIIIKGDENRVFNNTVFDVGPRDPSQRNEHNSKHLLIPTRAEPKKPWRKQHPLLQAQNAGSIFANNAVGNIVWRGEPLGNDKISNNIEFGTEPPEKWLVNPEKMDFRPRKGSSLIDAGKIIPGFEGDYKGKAPDIGAYEYGAKPWTAGITWDPGKTIGDVAQENPCSHSKSPPER